MKGYKLFVILFTLLLALYIVAEINRPVPVDWKMTLSAKDKNPYGAYILFTQLHDLFPKALINTYHLPVYNQLNNFQQTNTAYLLIDPELRLTASDVDVLLDYAVEGNYVFIASANFGRQLTDSLDFGSKRRFDLLNTDSITINFTNPALHSEKNYGFQRMTLDGYLSKFDSALTVVLGNNHLNDVNFIKIPYGEGAFFIHTLPVCFSNYFLLTRSNAAYAAKALSYLPGNIHTLFWDEYYKKGEQATRNPLRYILNNPWLRAAFRIGLLTMLLFILFGIKRRQRVIPVIVPLRNSTLDFVNTVGNVYFNQHDNKNIASKKINYFLEAIRTGLNVPTGTLNDEFTKTLAKKIALPEEKVMEVVRLIMEIQGNNAVSDDQLLELNRQLDFIYTFLNS